MSKQISAILFGLLWAIAGPQLPAFAQKSVFVDDAGTSTSNRADQDTTDKILQQDADGNWRLVPLESLESKAVRSGAEESADAPPDVPDFFFSKLEIEGTANEEWVDLIALMTVHVVTPERWVEVPLRFDQASLLDYQHEGVGDNAAPVADDQTRGHSWLLRGKGDHRLRMTLRVPLRKTLAGDFLQLELPRMEIITGSLSLRLPSNSVTIRREGSVRLLGTQVEGEQTLITAELPTERLELRWNIIEQQANPLMQKPTEVRLRFLDDKVELTALQRVQMSQSDELRIRMPSDDFALTSQGVRVIDSNGNARWVQPQAIEDMADEEQSDWVSIPLDDTFGTSVTLSWELRAPMPPNGRGFVIDGFEIADARRQAGTIEIGRPNGFRINQSSEGNVAVERIDVKDLPNSPTVSSLAYSFTGGQYRLQFSVEPTEPVVSLTPYYFVKVSQDRVEVEAIYRLSIDGGVVSRLPILWPGMKNQLWEVVPSSLTQGQPRRLQSNKNESPEVSEEDPVSWEMLLPDADDNLMDVGLSAVRYFETDHSEETFDLSLPILSEARNSSGWVIVSTDDDVEVSTRAGEGTVLTRQVESGLAALKVEPPDWTQTQPQTLFRFSIEHEDTSPQLEMDLTVRSQTIMTSSVVEVRNVDERPRVSQRLSYDVQFGRLSEIRLEIPESLYDQLAHGFEYASLRFLLDGQLLLRPAWIGTEVTLTLPEARMGEFDIVIEDYAPANASEVLAEEVSVPIITSSDSPLSTVTLIVPEQETLAVSVKGAAWTRVPIIADGRQWITDQPVTEVILQLDHSLALSPQRLKIHSAFLQTVIDDAGKRMTLATYEIRDSVDELALQLPADAIIPSVEWKWNGIAPQSDDLTVFPDSHEVRLKRPTSPQSPPRRLAQHVIQISYQSQGESGGGSKSQRVQFPQFAPDVWVQRMWWELKLPLSQHLFVAPSVMTPQFQWRREGFFWRRDPVTTYEAFRGSVSETIAIVHDSELDAGNVYPFFSYGAPSEVSFRTMSMSVIVFLGAGLTLCVSFLLLKVPAARHPLLWLAVGLAVMTVSIWHLQPMLLLLQPAAYGLVLPVCAAIFEYLTNGRRLALTRPSHDSTYREVGLSHESRMSDLGNLEITSTHVHQPAMSDSGIDR